MAVSACGTGSPGSRELHDPEKADLESGSNRERLSGREPPPIPRSGLPNNSKNGKVSAE